jgi:hypothetical protein
MYVDGLVDHILLYGLDFILFTGLLTVDRKHTSRKSMRCDCGQAFTRRTDLQSHVELTHTGDNFVSPSMNMNADAESLEGQGQSAVSMSMTQPSSILGSQTLLCCTAFPPCRHTFEDEKKFKIHVAYVFPQSFARRACVDSPQKA